MSNRRDPPSDFAQQEIYLPETLTETLQIKKRWPRSTVWAGGTHLLHAGSDPASPIIALSGVRELRRLVRSDTHIDIGAAVPIGRLLEVGSRFLPDFLVDTFTNIGPTPLLNVATVAGTICCPTGILPGSLALRMLDARLEIRRQGNTRWITATQFNGISSLDPSEIITRIRIPNRPWTHYLTHTFGRPYPPGTDSVSITALANVDRGTITDIRFAAVSRSTTLLRNREIEARFAGKRVPLPARDKVEFQDAFKADHVMQESFSQLSAHRVLYSFLSFLDRLE